MIRFNAEDQAVLPARRIIVLAAALLGAVALLLGVSPEAQAAPHWSLVPSANTTVAAGGQLHFTVEVTNESPGSEDGLSGNADGEVKIKAHLAPGLTGASIDPDQMGTEMSCAPPAGASTIECSGTHHFSSHGNTLIAFWADVDPNAAGVLTSTFEVEGDGLVPDETVKPVTVTPQEAPFGFSAFDFTIPGNAGSEFTQAGGHPYSNVTVTDFNTHTNPNPVVGPNDPVEDAREIVVDLPAGFFGNPISFAQCQFVDLVNNETEPRPLCPQRSQVGAMFFRHALGSFRSTPIFNMEHPPTVPARFAFNIKGAVVVLDAHVRSSGDYGLRITSANTPQALQVVGSTVTFWGVPFSADHDEEHGCIGKRQPGEGGPVCPSGADPVPFLRMPTSCTAAGKGLPVTGTVDSWQHPGVLDTASIETHEAPGYPLPPVPSSFPAGYPGPTEWGAPKGVDGCAKVPFEPSFSAAPTTNQADSPSGLSVDIGFPTDCWDPKPTTAEAEESICQSDMKESVVTLPEGMSINPSSASGRAACSPSQVGLITPVGQSSPIHFNEAPVSCPDASKIGAVQIDTPALEVPLKGGIYLAQQSQNPFNSLLGMYLVVEGSGVVIKQAGKVSADPNTGQLTTTFSNTPQTPFSNLHFELFGGPRAVLSTPPTCGTYTAGATLTPWSGNAAVDLASSFKLTGCGSGAFDPKLTAGTQNPLAGSYSPFHLRLSREDGTPQLGSLRLALPPGLVASLKDLAYCPDSTLAAISAAPGTGQAQIDGPSCPAASLVGTLAVGAGSGPTPFYSNTGKAYWAGPYKGAPISLAVVTPAVAGPLDLGNVVVRNRFEVDPATAKITAVSDPLPTILHGIPLDLKDIRLDLARPNYTLNPTSCDPLAFEGAIGSASGQSANRSVHFQAAGCDRLKFKPKLTLRLHGKANRGAHPALEAVVKMPKGGANLAGATVALPHSEFLDQGHIGTVCTRVQYAAGAGGGAECPKRSVYGKARAYSPILGYYLQGPVFLRSSSHQLPDLILSLHGPASQPIQVDAVGRIDSTKAGGIRTAFESIPDVPVSKVVLDMQGGKKGLLQNSTNLCRSEHHASALFEGQNGKLLQATPELIVDCKGKAKKKAKKGKGSY